MLAAPTRNSSASQLNSKILCVLDEPVTYFNRFYTWHWQAKCQTEPGSQHFVRKHSDVLRVVLEFGHVGRAIGCPQQMGLRSAPKSAQVLDGGDTRGHTQLL